MSNAMGALFMAVVIVVNVFCAALILRKFY